MTYSTTKKLEIIFLFVFFIPTDGQALLEEAQQRKAITSGEEGETLPTSPPPVKKESSNEGALMLQVMILVFKSN